MLSRAGHKQQLQPLSGLRATGDIYQSPPARHTGYSLPPYVGPSLQFSLDPDIWATTGVTINIFSANLIRTQSPWRYKFAFTSNVGSYDGTSWNYTPVDGDAGDHTLTVQLFDAWTNALLGTQTSTVHVTAQQSPARANPLRVVLMGDSVTQFNIYPPDFAALMNGAGNPAYVMYGSESGGTVGGHQVAHEGHSGKTWRWFLNNAPLDLNVNSPFWRTGVFSVADYVTTYCGGLQPDLWTIELGINDCFGALPYEDSSILSTISTMFGYADTLIAAIQAQCPNTDIGLLTTTPGNVLEAAFYANYAGADTSWGWQRIERVVVAQQIAHWSGKQSQKIWLLPCNAMLDTVNDYPANNGVHPLAGLGMQRIANCIYSWAKARMAVR